MERERDAREPGSLVDEVLQELAGNPWEPGHEEGDAELERSMDALFEEHEHELPWQDAQWFSARQQQREYAAARAAVLAEIAQLRAVLAMLDLLAAA